MQIRINPMKMRDFSAATAKKDASYSGSFFFFSSSFSFLPLLILEETRRLAATASPLQSSYRSQLVWVGKNRDRTRRGLYTSSDCFGIRVHLKSDAFLCYLDNRISILVLNLNYFMRVHRQHVQRKPSRLLKLFNLHQNRFEWHVRDAHRYISSRNIVVVKIYKKSFGLWFLFSWKLTLEIYREL